MRFTGGSPFGAAWRAWHTAGAAEPVMGAGQKALSESATDSSQPTKACCAIVPGAVGSRLSRSRRARSTLVMKGAVVQVRAPALNDTLL